jgi:polysaccharide pyruvyl transferase WcaK-like protein
MLLNPAQRIDRMTKTGKKIGLLHRVGGGNLGDDATLESVASSVRRRLPPAEIVALSMNPNDTEARHGIKSHPIRRNCWSIRYKRAENEQLIPARQEESEVSNGRTC